jgi:hypothetical protein
MIRRFVTRSRCSSLYDMGKPSEYILLGWAVLVEYQFFRRLSVTIAYTIWDKQ